MTDYRKTADFREISEWMQEFGFKRRRVSTCAVSYLKHLTPVREVEVQIWSDGTRRISWSDHGRESERPTFFNNLGKLKAVIKQLAETSPA